MHKLLTITGPSCSGKSTLLNELVTNHNYKSIISHTTRPVRPGEVDGVDYHFISQAHFDLMVIDNEFIEHISFNGFSYGVCAGELIDSEDRTSVLIVEPNGLLQILQYAEKNNISVNSVYVDGYYKTLLTRYITRLNGEDLTKPGVAERHAERISSITHELEYWYPYTRERGMSSIDKRKLKYLTISEIPYDLVLRSLDATNTEEVLKQLKEMEYK